MRSAVFAAFALLAVVGARASADPLPRLHLTAFALVSSSARPADGKPFDLVIDVRVTQRVASLDGVVLPALGPLEILGDEKHVLASRAGTDYRETIAVVAHAPGTFTIEPAYLDAVDSRDGKPKRFLSNAVTLHVAGGPAVAALRTQARLRAAEVLAGIVVVALLAWAVLTFRRPSQLAAPAETEPATLQPAEDLRAESASDPYALALTDLRADPSRAGALRARERVWSAVGASQYDTLGDVLRRPDAHDAAVRAVLRALERAAFTHDDDVRGAVDDAAAVLARKAAP